MKKKTIKIVIILVLIFILYNCGSSVEGYSAEECQEALASWALGFYNEAGDTIHYYCEDNVVSLDSTNSSERAKAYLGSSNACSHGYTYGMDCVGWVSFAIHKCLGLGSKTSFSYFVTPTGTGKSGYGSHTIVDKGGGYSSWKDELIPGDILIASCSYAGEKHQHVMIYVGDGKIVHCAAGLQYQSVEESSYYTLISGYARLKDEQASAVTSINTDYSAAISGSSTTSSSSGISFSNFYFNGVPDGKYSIAQTSILTTIINSIAEIADYLIGLLTYLIRIVFVGWTAIIDNVFNWSVQTIVDTNVEAGDLGISSVEVESADNDSRITIEKLFYNQYELTDINIFDN